VGPEQQDIGVGNLLDEMSARCQGLAEADIGTSVPGWLHELQRAVDNVAGDHGLLAARRNPDAEVPRSMSGERPDAHVLAYSVAVIYKVDHRRIERPNRVC
jgi:hypothetical protein